jgi:hypothetical protein
MQLLTPGITPVGWIIIGVAMGLGIYLIVRSRRKRNRI